MAQHTEGPWVANSSHDGLGWRVESDAVGYPNDGWCVCSELIGPDADANARLIAAAPELLEALEGLLRGLGPNGYVLPAGAPATVKARAVIAKAKSEALDCQLQREVGNG